MNTWGYLRNMNRQSEMVTCMESLRPAIYQIVLNSITDDINDFDYYVDCYVDHEIRLYHDGCEFAAVNTDQFKNAGHFIAWVINALNTYYMEDPMDMDDDTIKKIMSIQEEEDE